MRALQVRARSHTPYRWGARGHGPLDPPKSGHVVGVHGILVTLFVLCTLLYEANMSTTNETNDQL